MKFIEFLNESGDLKSIGSRYNVSIEPIVIGPISVRVYRVGKINNKEIYFGGSEADAKAYEMLHSGDTVKIYDVITKKTIIAKNHFQLYNYFNNEKTMQDAVWRADKASGFKSSVEAWRKVQSRLMGQTRSKGYDSVIFTSPPPPATTELVVIKPSVSIKLIGEV
jgi:hypothetical protein